MSPPTVAAEPIANQERKNLFLKEDSFIGGRKLSPGIVRE
jgi:hypothetical protein